MTATIENLIREAFGPGEAARFTEFSPNREQLEQALEVGHAILSRAPSIGGACAYLSAAWTATLRDALKLPIFCVAGDLEVRGKTAFGSSTNAVARQLGRSSRHWDGHCWMLMGEWIGDLSISRTADANPPQSNLRNVIHELFGQNAGPILWSSNDAFQSGFSYTAKYVASDDELTGLIKGACSEGLLR